MALDSLRYAGLSLVCKYWVGKTVIDTGKQIRAKGKRLPAFMKAKVLFFQWTPLSGTGIFCAVQQYCSRILPANRNCLLTEVKLDRKIEKNLFWLFFPVALKFMPYMF